MANFTSNIYLHVSAHTFNLRTNPPIATFLVLSVVYLSEQTHNKKFEITVFILQLVRDKSWSGFLSSRISRFLLI